MDRGIRLTLPCLLTITGEKMAADQQEEGSEEDEEEDEDEDEDDDQTKD